MTRRRSCANWPNNSRKRPASACSAECSKPLALSIVVVIRLLRISMSWSLVMFFVLGLVGGCVGIVGAFVIDVGLAAMAEEGAGTALGLFAVVRIGIGAALALAGALL